MLGGEIPALSKQLDAHQRDLAALNADWELAARDRLANAKKRATRAYHAAMDRDLYHPTDADRVPAPSNDVERPTKQNTSETSAPTNLSNLLQLKNKIEFKKFEMAEKALMMDLKIGQARAILLAVRAYRAEEYWKRRTEVTFEAENIGQSFMK